MISDQALTMTVEGKDITYYHHSQFLIQVGHGPKGAYKTHLIFIGDMARAFFWYLKIQVGEGYKKRLLMGSHVLMCYKSWQSEVEHELI
jgi:hypothetical protein